MQDPKNSPKINDLELDDPLVRKFLDQLKLLQEKAREILDQVAEKSRCFSHVRLDTLCRVAQLLLMTPSFGRIFEPYDDHDHAVFRKWMRGDDRFQISGGRFTVRSCDHPECVIRRLHEK